MMVQTPTFLFYAPAVAGLVMLFLASWLLWMSPERRQARAFSVLLGFRGLSLIALTVVMTATTPAVFGLGGTLYPVFCLGAAVAVLYFTAVYPAPRSWLPRGRLGPLLFFVPLAAVMTWAFFDSSLVSPSPPPAAVGFANSFNWFMASTRGPIGVAPTLLDLFMIVPALVLVREFSNKGPGRARSTLLLVSFGFFVPAACSCLMAGAFLQLRGGMPQPADPSVFNYAEMGIFGLWFAVMIVLLVYLGMRMRRDPESSNRRAAGMFAGLVVASAAIGASTSLFEDPINVAAAIFVMVACWSLLGALMVTYGVVRHSLFDIDLRFKRTLERGTIAAAFVVVYFVVTESATELFADFSGSAYIGIAAAALLVFVLHPLERLAATLTGGAMPNTKPLTELAAAERNDFYREQLRLMWMDGAITAKDRKVLANLRTRIRLEAEVAERIELEVLEEAMSTAI